MPLIKNVINCQNMLCIRLKTKFLKYRSVVTLPEVLIEKIEERKQQLEKLRQAHNNTIVCSYRINDIFHGMRGVQCLVGETAEFHVFDFIHYRGLSLENCRKLLKETPKKKYPSAEALFWFLLTGDVPDPSQTFWLREELQKRADLFHIVPTVLKLLQKGYPLPQLALIYTILSSESKFRKAYNRISRNDHWMFYLGDTLDLLATLPQVCSLIYYFNYRDEANIPLLSKDLTWTENFARMLGYNDKKFLELFEMIIFANADSDSGSMGLHGGRIVSSALADAYLSFATCCHALSGPLLLGAGKNALIFLEKMIQSVGDEPSTRNIRKYLVKRIIRDDPIPGYGRPELTGIDPRHVFNLEFINEYVKDENPMINIALKTTHIAPVLLLHFKKHPYPHPNVEALKGVLLSHCGMKEKDFFSVLTAVSQSIGLLSNLIWARALNLPMERPRSATYQQLQSLGKKAHLLKMHNTPENFSM